MSIGNALALLDGKNELTADDARALRRVIYGEDATVTRADAEALFKLNADAGSLSQEWQQLFIEAMTDYAVHEQAPSGYIDNANADWLVAQTRNAGRVREDEIEMLIHVLEEADESPAALSNFVLELVKSVILAKLKQNQGLDRSDVERLRRVIYSKGGDGNIAVTRHEAEALFDVNDALKGADADPAWLDLFKRAVANAVLFESDWHPDGKAELHRQAWLADTGFHPLRHFVTGLESPAAWSDILESAREMRQLDFQDHSLDRAYQAQAAAQADAEKLSDDETHWLIERIRGNGVYDKNERAVVDYIRDNARSSGAQVEALMAGLDGLPDQNAA